MIRYALACAQGCEFEAWFRDSADFDDQAARGLVACPQCGDGQVRKQMMAPAVSTARRREAQAERRGRMQTMAAAAGAFRKHLKDNFTDVGERFPEEARAIHDGESESRGIYGQASAEEARALREDGVEVFPLPPGLSPDADETLN